MADDPRPWTPRLIQVREAALENRMNYEESCISNTTITIQPEDPNQSAIPFSPAGPSQPARVTQPSRESLQIQIQSNPAYHSRNSFKISADRPKATITFSSSFPNNRFQDGKLSLPIEPPKLVSVQSKKHRLARRVFRTLRLRRKVNSTEGLETPKVIKESDNGFFKKFQQFFKRKKKKKEPKMTDEVVTSQKTTLACPNPPVKKISVISVNVGDRSRLKEIFYNMFGSCFGIIKLNVIAQSDNSLYIVGQCITIATPETCEMGSAVATPSSHNMTEALQKKAPIMFEIQTQGEFEQGPGPRPGTPKPCEPSAHLRKERPSLRELEDKQVRAMEKRLQKQIERTRPGTARRERVQQKKIDLQALEAERKRAQEEHISKKQSATEGKLSEIEKQRKEKIEKARARAEAARAKKQEQEHAEMMERHRQAVQLRENLRNKRRQESLNKVQVDVTAKSLVENALAAVRIDFENVMEGVSLDDVEDIHVEESSNGKCGNTLIDDLNQALGDAEGGEDVGGSNNVREDGDGAEASPTDGAQPGENGADKDKLNDGDGMIDDIPMDSDLESDDGSISVGEMSEDEDEDVWGIGDAFDNCPVRPTRPGTYIIKRAYDDEHVDIENNGDNDGNGDGDNNSIDSFYENPVGEECAEAAKPASAH